MSNIGYNGLVAVLRDIRRFLLDAEVPVLLRKIYRLPLYRAR